MGEAVLFSVPVKGCYTIHAYFCYVHFRIHFIAWELCDVSQKGLEKLNDITTIHFQHSTNHREGEALKQLLENKTESKNLRVHEGCQRTKWTLTCTACKTQGHAQQVVLPKGLSSEMHKAKALPSDFGTFWFGILRYVRMVRSSVHRSTLACQVSYEYICRALWIL